MSVYPQITDMSGAYIQHSDVIGNFVFAVRKQMKDSLCRIYPDNVQYKWKTEDKEYTVIPDVSINCSYKSQRRNFFFDAPRFVMEVLSDKTEKYDRTEKMELYRMMEVDEYWIADWKKKTVEVYLIDNEPDNIPRYFQKAVVTEKNKEDLQLYTFPHIKLDFDELFDVTSIF